MYKSKEKTFLYTMILILSLEHLFLIWCRVLAPVPLVSLPQRRPPSPDLSVSQYSSSVLFKTCPITKTNLHLTSQSCPQNEGGLNCGDN